MKHNFTYFFSEGVGNMFSHGFMSFAAIGITVACLVVMGTFSLVAYNAEVQLETLESEYEILAFVDETCDDARTQQVGRALSKIANVKDVEFITKEQATESFEKKYENDYMLQDLDAEIFRDRYAVFVSDLNAVNQTAEAIRGVEGVAKVRVDEDIAGGFITLGLLLALINWLGEWQARRHGAPVPLPVNLDCRHCTMCPNGKA